MTPEELEDFRRSVNGTYVRGKNAMVKAAKHTNDPRAYAQWLREEGRRQRESFAARRTPIAVAPPPDIVAEEPELKRYGDIFVDLKKVTHLKENQKTVTVSFGDGTSVLVSKEYQEKLLNDMKFKEE